MLSDAANELWKEAYNRFRKVDADLLADFEDVIRKKHSTGQNIRLGSDHSQKQLVAFIGEKMELSQQRAQKYASFQPVVRMLVGSKDLLMTATAASPPAHVAIAGIFLAFSMAEMYSSEKKARSQTALLLAKVFCRRKVACGRVYPSSDREPEDLRDLRNSLHTTYVDLYHAILRATAKLVCALDDTGWEKKLSRGIKMTFGWSEWQSIGPELEELEKYIRYDEDEIKSYGNMGPQTPAAVPRITATGVRRGRNELHVAAVTNDLPKMQELLGIGRPDVNERTKHLWTACNLAVEKGFLDVVEMLLLAPEIDVNAQNDEGNTALHVAAINKKLPENQRVKMIRLLTSHGAKVDVSNARQRTAFLDAAKTGDLKIVQVLRKEGADINQVSGINGWSALLDAAGHGHFAVVQWLVDNMADTKIKAKAGKNRGKTAAQVARKWGEVDIADFIEASEAWSDELVR